MLEVPIINRSIHNKHIKINLHILHHLQQKRIPSSRICSKCIQVNNFTSIYKLSEEIF